ncbi:MAG TPA: hypothetical protein VIV58_00140 [Kofleriaceae bacterium]
MKTIILACVVSLAFGCSNKKPESTVPTNKQQEMPKDDSAKKPETKSDAPDPKAPPASADPCGG